MNDSKQKPFRFGVSRFAAATGHCPWSSRARLWRLKTGREVQEDNYFLEYGRINERRAVTAVECACDMFFDGTGEEQTKFSMDMGWADLVAYPDGHDGSTGLEVKCPQSLHVEIPIQYLVQMCGQFMVAGFERIIYAEWAPAETRIWEVLPDRSMEDLLYPALKEFVGYVEADKEPPRYTKKSNPKIQFTGLPNKRID